MSGDPGATIRAIHRFGLGPRPGDLARIGKDARDLFRTEARQGQAAVLTGLTFASTAELGPAFAAFQDNERRERERRAAVQPVPTQPDPAQPAQAATPAGAAPAPRTPPMPPLPQRVYREEARAAFHAALDPLGGFTERLVAFWTNHFAVSVNKGAGVRALAGLMAREAIRPHILGSFADMLLAVETHPAMILFLDNQRSIGPNSRAGLRRGRGLNENLAREILELHTLGVAGGYGQGDVTALARIITGWTLAQAGEPEGPPGTFRFNPNLHEPGAHALLGRTYPEGGFEQGRAALRDLARHPSTARHVARKLARHFVADEPPAAMTARLAKVFRDSDGDLRQVSIAVVESPEAWEAPSTKMRTPQEFLVASARALGRRPDAPQILGPLAAMGQMTWLPGGPNGFPDVEAAWASPEGIKTRLDVAAAIGRQAGWGVNPAALVDEIFGPSVSAETRSAILRAESRPQAVAIALMAPEFQRR